MPDSVTVFVVLPSIISVAGPPLSEILALTANVAVPVTSKLPLDASTRPSVPLPLLLFVPAMVRVLLLAK